MNLSATRSNGKWLSQFFARARLRPGVVFALIILVALIFFEIFNYSTTDYALRDLLGDLRFAGIRWSTILAVAFCGIDFAGIARLFTPEQRSEEPKEVWYLFGAWLLAATMNAGLTWWGVSMAIASHSLGSTAVVDQKTLLSVVPVFVALMVWVIRILIIGSLSVASDRLFSGSERLQTARPRQASTALHTSMGGVNMTPRPVSPRSSLGRDSTPVRPEPSYHNVNARPMPKPATGDSSTSPNLSYRL